MKETNACHNVEQFEIFLILLRNKFWYFILQKKDDILLLNLWQTPWNELLNKQITF